jgi:hypothetical protein
MPGLILSDLRHYTFMKCEILELARTGCDGEAITRQVVERVAR